MTRVSNRKCLAALGGALLVGGCVTRPTPELIASCADRAVVELPPTAKARSLLVARSGALPRSVFTDRLLRDWRLDFIEVPSRPDPGVARGEPPYRAGDPVHRVRLVAAGSPECVRWDRRDWTAHEADRLSAPSGSCIAVERGVESRAEMHLITYPGEAPMSEIFEARRPGGATVARIVDFSLRDGPEASRVDCGKLVRTFPRDPGRVLLGHVAEPR